jgi:hypothetical protein
LRIAVLVAAIGLIAPAGALVSTAPPGRQRVVPCSESIHTTRFPYVGSPRRDSRYRLVLDVVSVPPRYLKQVVATNERPWSHWRKAGLVVRAGSELTVSVPHAWRSQVAIVWGNGGHGVFSSVHFVGCGSNPHFGNAFAGGFYLRSRSACLPLLFRTGKRAAMVRFGIGRRCY